MSLSSGSHRLIHFHIGLSFRSHARARVSLLNRLKDGVPEVPAIWAEAGLCVHPHVRHKRVRQVALRALDVGPRRGLRPEFHVKTLAKTEGMRCSGWNTLMRREKVLPQTHSIVDRRSRNIGLGRRIEAAPLLRAPASGTARDVDKSDGAPDVVELVKPDVFQHGIDDQAKHLPPAAVALKTVLLDAERGGRMTASAPDLPQKAITQMGGSDGISVRAGLGWANPGFSIGAVDSLMQVPLTVDGIYNWEGGKWHPFVGAGFGVHFLRFTLDVPATDNTDTRLGFNVGGASSTSSIALLQ